MIVVTCRLPVLYSTYLGTLPVESCAWVHPCFFFTLGGKVLKKTLAVPFIFERRFFYTPGQVKVENPWPCLSSFDTSLKGVCKILKKTNYSATR